MFYAARGNVPPKRHTQHRAPDGALYAVNASDPMMLTGAIVVVALIVGVATMLPAWRASRVNPASALHPE